MAKSARVSRRRMAGLLVGLTGLALAGCGGGDELDPLGLIDDSDSGNNYNNTDSGGAWPLHDAFVKLVNGMTESTVRKKVPGTPTKDASTGKLRWETSAEILEIKFVGSIIDSAVWTDRATGRTEKRTFGIGAGSGSPGTLYEAFKGLRSGMTKSQVIAYVPVRPSQGADTNQVLWVKGEEALGVKFNGSSNGSIITFAQWGLSIEAGGRDETRNF